jgi:hypothetical protein
MAISRESPWDINTFLAIIGLLFTPAFYIYDVEVQTEVGVYVYCILENGKVVEIVCYRQSAPLILQ